MSSQIAAAIHGKSPEVAAAAFAELGKSQGFDFTSEEAAEARNQILQSGSMYSLRRFFMA